MWTRRTLHECASEMEQISHRFRSAYLRITPMSASERDAELRSTSIEGVELLRILALTIRSEQDTGMLPRDSSIVGAIKSPASPAEIASFLTGYRPPHRLLQDFSPLRLREGLNKIAHVNGSQTGFAVDANSHDLLLSGTYQRVPWLAVLSIPELCRGVHALPDRIVSTT